MFRHLTIAASVASLALVHPALAQGATVTVHQLTADAANAMVMVAME